MFFSERYDLICAGTIIENELNMILFIFIIAESHQYRAGQASMLVCMAISQRTCGKYGYGSRGYPGFYGSAATLPQEHLLLGVRVPVLSA